MAQTTKSFYFELGSFIRGLEVVSGRVLNQMAAGYRHPRTQVRTTPPARAETIESSPDSFVVEGFRAPNTDSSST